MSGPPPLQRQWTILRTLSARRYGATVRELAEEHGVSQKTIRRDLTQLQALGFPVSPQPGMHGRNHWMATADSRTPPLTFDISEVLARRRRTDSEKGSHMFLSLAVTQAGCRRLFPRRLLHRLATHAILAATAVFAQAQFYQAGYADESAPPNIIIIMADDLGYAELGCYGQTKINTPQIDRLAADGLRFTQAYAGSHVCQPSRSVLMTGLHTGHTPVRANDVNQMLLPDDVTLAELLHDAGYATGGFGKWGLGPQQTTGQPNRQGFDEFFGQYLQVHAHFYYPYWVEHNERQQMLPGNENGRRGQYVQDEIHNAAMRFIREHRQGPFFAYLPYIIPHVELVVPEPWEDPYRGKFPKVRLEDSRPGYISSDDGFVTFAGMVSRLDAYVGEVRTLLEELGIADETIVVFTSDNGGQGGGKDNAWGRMTDFFDGNAPLRGYKGTFYEGGLRVPFIAHWPGKTKAGSLTDHITGFQDMLPTFCEIAGIKSPDATDGISIVPTLTGAADQTDHIGLYWEYRRGSDVTRAARMGRWKAIQMKTDGPVQLYDLETDIGEARNVAADHPAIVRETIEFMDGAHVDQRAYPDVIERKTIEDYVR